MPRTAQPDASTLAEPVHVDALHDHLVHVHRRRRHELRGMPLTAVHDLEHLDDELGLLLLNHSHRD